MQPTPTRFTPDAATGDPRVAMHSDQFEALETKVYLDTACIGIPPRMAVTEVRNVVESIARVPAASGTDHHRALSASRDTCRSSLARLLGAGVDDIALTECATHGLGVVARALDLRHGDRVLITDLEFIQMGAIWRQFRSAGVHLDVVAHRNGSILPDDVRGAITRRTRVLGISSVMWTNGFRVDLAAIAEICRQHGVMLLVDAAQHLGSLPFDVRDYAPDVIVSSGHKWLNAPFGCGVLYLSPNVRDRLTLPIAGFFAASPPHGLTWGESFQDPMTSPLADLNYRRDASSWEIGGTANSLGPAALAVCADLATAVGTQAMVAHSLTLTDHLIEALDRLQINVVSRRDPAVRSAIVTFSVGSPQDNVALARHLADCRIAVSVRYTSGIGGVRVSCHYFNSIDDIDSLIDVVTAWLRHRGDPYGDMATVIPRQRNADQFASSRSLASPLSATASGLP